MQHLCLYFPPVRVDLAGMPDTPSISKDTHMTHIRSVNVPLARNLNLGQKKSSSRRQLGVSGQTVTSQHPWCEAPRANLVKGSFSRSQHPSYKPSYFAKRVIQFLWFLAKEQLELESAKRLEFKQAKVKSSGLPGQQKSLRERAQSGEKQAGLRTAEW